MRVTKNELKNIVKECLREILSEGLGVTPQRPMQQTESVKRPSIVSSRLPPKKQVVSQPAPTPQLQEAIRREAGGNSVMESILADTAASTLPKMLQNEGRPHIPSTAGGGVAEHVVAASNPEELFGDEVASKWADLAFMSSPKK